MGPTGVRSRRCRAGPFLRLRGRICFQLLEAARIPRLVTPSSTFRARSGHSQILLTPHGSDSSVSLSAPTDPGDYGGPTCTTPGTLPSQGQQINSLNCALQGSGPIHRLWRLGCGHLWGPFFWPPQSSRTNNTFGPFPGEGKLSSGMTPQPAPLKAPDSGGREKGSMTTETSKRPSQGTDAIAVQSAQLTSGHPSRSTPTLPCGGQLGPRGGPASVMLQERGQKGPPRELPPHIPSWPRAGGWSPIWTPCLCFWGT